MRNFVRLYELLLTCLLIRQRDGKTPHPSLKGNCGRTRIDRKVKLGSGQDGKRLDCRPRRNACYGGPAQSSQTASGDRFQIQARIEILAGRREVLDAGIGHEEVGRSAAATS